MSDNNKMSRRDWFRLRPRHDKPESPPSEALADASTDGDCSMGEAPNGLQPIAQPENHDGMDLSELPPMREALLSEEQVRQLFNDIAAHASNVLLMQRSARSRRATASAASTATTEQLTTACESVVSGNVPRIQIRYDWQAANWIDTLERREDGFRLVRITHMVPGKS